MLYKQKGTYTNEYVNVSRTNTSIIRKLIKIIYERIFLLSLLYYEINKNKIKTEKIRCNGNICKSRQDIANYKSNLVSETMT